MMRWVIPATAAFVGAFLPAYAAPFAYVANATTGTVSVVDVATNTVTATIPVGCTPVGLAVNSSATRLYAACSGSNNTKVIDATTNTVIATPFTCTGASATDVAVDPAGTRVYFTCLGPANSVAIIDTATNTLSTTVPVGLFPIGVAFNPAGSRAYVSNNASNNVSVIDTATNTVTATIPVGLTPRGVAVNPAGTRVYVSNTGSNSVSVIDTATNTVIASIPVGNSPFGLTVSPDGSQIVVANKLGDSVSVIAAATNTVTATSPLGAGTSPVAIAIPPDGTRAYIVNQTANNVSVMDLATFALSAPVAVGTQPFDIAVVPSTPPTVTINQATLQGDPTNGSSPVLFDVVFSEPVTGFTGSDVSFAGSTVGGALAASVTGSGATYSVSVTGMAGAGTVVASIPAGAAADLTGSPSLASTSTDNTVTVDTVAPTVTINQAIAQADPAGAAPITFTVVFSEAVTGFTASDVSFAGSTAGGTLVAGVSGSGAAYTVSVTGMTSGGTVVASIPAGAASDLAGNLSTASTSTDNTVTFTTAPTVTINQAVGQADPTNASPIVFTAAFDQPVAGFTASDVSFAGSTVGGTLAAAVSGGPATYTVTVSGMVGNGTVVASIPAGAVTSGPLSSLASTSTDNTVTFDAVAPTVTINQAGGQADPASASPIVFAVVFSEPVTGFTGSDVSFAGSTAAGTLAAAVSGSGASYTVSVSGMTGNGTVVASIPAAAAADLAGNASIASTSVDNSVTYTGASAVVTTFTGPSATGTGSITASFTGGGPTCSFTGQQYIASPPGTAPVPPSTAPGIVFPHGLFTFSTINCAPGSTLAFTITYPAALLPGTQYWKYGPEAANATPHWYVLPATIAGNVATFTITDGGQGDDDLAANGTIVDQGGPGAPGTGGVIQTPTLTEWGLILLGVLLLAFAAPALRRRSVVD
jgi:YVTN family beta-propeller protein